jgi:hypothetical protein
MNRIVRYSFLGVLIPMFLLIACGKGGESETPVDEIAPEITIEKPVDGDSFLSGLDEIEITAQFTDNVMLDTCIVTLSTNLKSLSLKEELNTQDVVASISDPVPFQPDPVGYHISEKSFELKNESPFGFIPENTTIGQYKLKIQAIDVAGNKSYKEVMIQIASAL